MKPENYDTGKPILNLILGFILILSITLFIYSSRENNKIIKTFPGGSIEEFHKFYEFNRKKITKIVVFMQSVDRFNNSKITIMNQQVINEFKNILLLIKKEDRAKHVYTQKYSGTYCFTFYFAENKYYSIIVRGDPSNENPEKSYIMFLKNSFIDMNMLEKQHGHSPNYFENSNGESGNTYINYKIYLSIKKLKNIIANEDLERSQLFVEYN